MTLSHGYYVCFIIITIIVISREKNYVSSTAIRSSALKSVVIIGGGFGGLYTALKLNELLTTKLKEKEVCITLVDPKDKFIFLPLLYEFCIENAAIQEVGPTYQRLLENLNINFVQDTVDDIDINSNEIRLNSKRVLKFDKAVIAVGSQPRVDIIKGAKELSLPFYRIEDAYKLRTSLKYLKSSEKEHIRVVVIGGGYSGVEIATNVAEYLGENRAKITIVHRNDAIMHSSPTFNREVAEKSLNVLKIASRLNSSVIEVMKEGVMIQHNLADTTEFVPADLVISTFGVQASKLVEGISGLQKDKNNRLRTNRYLQSLDQENIYALGDCSCIDNMLVPSTAQVAIQQAEVVANNILTDDSNFQPFTFVNLGEMLTLGGKDGAISSLSGLVQIDGHLASIARRIIYAARMPTNSQKITALIGSSLVMGNKLIKENILDKK